MPDLATHAAAPEHRAAGEKKLSTDPGATGEHAKVSVPLSDEPVSSGNKVVAQPDISHRPNCPGYRYKIGTHSTGAKQSGQLGHNAVNNRSRSSKDDFCSAVSIKILSHLAQ
jgi:hypothetical protein